MQLLDKIQTKTLKAGVVGLGYVGLPLAVEKAKAGFTTISFDVQSAKVDMVNAGHNYIGDVVDSDLAAQVWKLICKKDSIHFEIAFKPSVRQGGSKKTTYSHLFMCES